MKTNSRRLLIAGGGTGGHILAGVAIAEAWAETNQCTLNSESILFVGARAQMEERLVPKYGIQLELLSLGSLNRVSLKQKLITFGKLPLAFLKAIWIVARFRPTHAIGVGGYASGPTILVCALLSFVLRTKTAVLEQNSILGFTNRRLVRWVDKVLTAFERPEAVPTGIQTVLTGNPIRSRFQTLPPAETDPFRIFVFGGSQGARGINRLMTALLPDLFKNIPNLEVVLQSGPTDFDEVSAAVKELPKVQVRKFIDEMETEYRRASLVICRSGASSLSELARVQRAAILVPLPTSADDQQAKNARHFAEKGGARVFEQSRPPQELSTLIRELAQHPEQIHALELASSHFSRPQAAEAVVRQLLAD